MKNKKGFISTGLIYSFFLIFLTLFLTTITNYLYKKQDLSLIEESIKISLNTNMYIDDFHPGDLITFVEDCNKAGEFAKENSYLVVDTITNDNGGICGSNGGVVYDACLILYSYFLSDDDTDAITLDDIKNDIGTSIVFDQYRYNILYKYDGWLTFDSYKLYDSGYLVKTFSNSGDYKCDFAAADKNSIYCSMNPIGIIGGIYSGSMAEAKYRKRVVMPLSENRTENCNFKGDPMGAIYVKD